MSLCRILLVCRFAFLFLTLTTFAAHGETWTSISSSTTEKLQAVTMATNKVGLAVGSRGTLLKTTNGGLLWKQERFNGSFSHTFNAVCMPDTESVAMAVGENGQAMYQFHSMATWSAFTPVADTLYGVCSRVDTILTFVSVGTNGFIGQYQWHVSTWQVGGGGGKGDPPPHDTSVLVTETKVLSVHTSASLRAVAFSPEQKGYIVGDSGIVLTSTNKGTTWARQSVGGNISLRAVAVISSDKIIAVGLDGAMWQTTNKGTSWQSIAPAGLHTNLNTISFIDAQNGVVAGDDGLVLQTTDQGATWVRVGVNSFAALLGVSCMQTPDGPNRVAVGEGGAMVQSLFGGSPVSYSVDNNALVFGDVEVGAKKIKQLSFNNLSADGYVTARVTTEDPRLTFSPDRVIVDFSASGVINVSFTPTDTGAINATLVVFTDASWVPDTIHVSGRGVAAIASVPTDTVRFDSAFSGRLRMFSIRNTGTSLLTATVAFVSDTNIAVAVGASAAPNDSLSVAVTLKHTLTHDLSCFVVLHTNSFVHPDDTVYVSMKGVPSSGVRDVIGAPMLTAVAYPNPLPARHDGVLHVSSLIGLNATLQIFDERGAVVGDFGGAGNRDGAWAVPEFMPGRYFLKFAVPGGGQLLGKLIVE